MPRSSSNRSNLRYRLGLLISIIIITPLGYIVRFAGDGWLNDLFGSVAYQILWVLLLALLAPQASLLWIAVGVCLASCAIEFLQLWQNPSYLAARATFLGRLILGNTFLWSDFPGYFIGGAMGWAWAKCCQYQLKLKPKRQKTR